MEEKEFMPTTEEKKHDTYPWTRKQFEDEYYRLKEDNQKLREALTRIDQFSDAGNYVRAIIEMKRLASESLLEEL